MTGPYATAAETYWAAGWRGILPLPPRAKKDPPKGYTGQSGRDPAFPDIHAWANGREANGNICLRMPPNVIGIDVDDYGDKNGGETLRRAEAAHGDLPATWRSTSRDDGVSGIRLYRVPEGLAWPGEVGPSIEIIQARHRYTVVWPSVHPDTGATYRWINPAGLTSTSIPDPDDLSLLPAAWVTAYTGGHLAVETPRNQMANETAAVWLASMTGAHDEPCRRMADAVMSDVAVLRSGVGSAHDAGCRATGRLVRLAAEGHAGVLEVIGQVHQAFTDNVTNPRRPGHRRSQLEAHTEWRDLLVSAVNLVSADMPSAPSCDCGGALTALIVNERPPTFAPPATAGSVALSPEPLVEEPLVADDTTGEEAAVDDRTTWWPRNLGPVLSGIETEPPPTVLCRQDGQPLWYAGKINGLIGESESGKTWVALLAVAQELNAGERVLYLDFEDAAPGIVSRLRALGVADSELQDGLDYADPSESLHTAASSDLGELLRERTYSLIVIDGFNASMTLMGLDLMSNTDVTKFFQILLRPLAKTGATIAYVDHIGKNNQEDAKGGIGAQAKRAMTTGCVIKVKVSEPFGRGMTGRLALIVDKDRAGHVRGASAEGRNAGTAVLVSDRATGKVHVELQNPDLASPSQKRDGKRSMVMERVSEWLQTGPEKTSKNALRHALAGRNAALDEALDELIRRGYVRQEKVGAGFSHVILKSFTVAEDLTSETNLAHSPHLAPTSPGANGPGPSDDLAHSPHPYRWGEGESTEAGVGTGVDPTSSAGRGRHDGGGDDDEPIQTRQIAPVQQSSCISCSRSIPAVIARTWQGNCGDCAHELGLT